MNKKLTSMLIIGLFLVSVFCVMSTSSNSIVTGQAINNQINSQPITNTINGIQFTNYNITGYNPTYLKSNINGTLFIAIDSQSKIIKASETGSIHVYAPPTPSARPYDVAINSNGTVYFTEISGNKIGRLYESGSFKEFTIPTPSCEPRCLAINSNGTIYFTENNANKIGRLYESGSFAEFTIPTLNSCPFGIAINSNNTIYFTEQSGNKVGRLYESGSFREYNTGGTNLRSLRINGNQTIFFTEYSNGAIGKLYESGTLHEYSIPTSSAHPQDLAINSNGLIYFTENANKIGRMSEAGSFVEYPLTWSGYAPAPYGICINNNGTAIFTNNGNQQFGKFNSLLGSPYFQFFFYHPFFNEHYYSGNIVPVYFNENGTGFNSYVLSATCKLYFNNNLTVAEYLILTDSQLHKTDTNFYASADFTAPVVASSVDCEILVIIEYANGLGFFDNQNKIKSYSDNYYSNDIGIDPPSLNALNDDVTFQAGYPQADGNYSEGSNIVLRASGTGTDLTSQTIFVDWNLYYQTNTTSTHFYNNTATIKPTVGTNWYSNITFSIPYTFPKVCHIWIRVLMHGYNYVFGNSGDFTINYATPNLNNDVSFTADYPTADGNYTESKPMNIRCSGTGDNLIGQTIFVDYYMYFQFGHVNTHFKNSTAVVVKYNYWFSNITISLPNVTYDVVCHIWVRVLMDGYNYVYGNSPDFTLNIIKLDADSKFVDGFPQADGNYSTSQFVQIEMNGTGKNILGQQIDYSISLYYVGNHSYTTFVIDKFTPTSDKYWFCNYTFQLPYISTTVCLYWGSVKLHNYTGLQWFFSNNFTINYNGSIIPPSSQKPIYITLINSGEYHNGTGSMVEISSNSINFDFQIVCQDGISSARLNYIFTSNSTGLNNTGSLTLNLVGGDVYAGLWGVSLPAFNEEGILTFNVTATSEKALVEISENNTLYVIKGFSFYEIFYSFNFIILIAGIILAFFGFAIYRKHIFLGLVFMLFGSLAILYALFGIFLSLGLI